MTQKEPKPCWTPTAQNFTNDACMYTYRYDGNAHEKSIAEPPPKPAIVLGSEPWRTCVRYSHCLYPRVIAIIASSVVIIIKACCKCHCHHLRESLLTAVWKRNEMCKDLNVKIKSNFIDIVNRHDPSFAFSAIGIIIICLSIHRHFLEGKTLVRQCIAMQVCHSKCFSMPTCEC